MNQEIINEISEQLAIKNKQVEAVLKLLQEGNTIPFIARYRKEVTGALDEEQIRKINEVYEYQESLLKRKGAKYIIAEWISDNASYRKELRRRMFREGILTAKKKKNAVDEKKVYEMYYDYSEPVKRMKAHRILAVNRGEKEDVLSVSISVNEEEMLGYLETKIIKNKSSFVTS